MQDNFLKLLGVLVLFIGAGAITYFTMTLVLTLYRVCGDDRMEVCLGSPPLGKTVVDTRQIKVTFEEHR